MHEEESIIKHAISEGAMGYLSKNAEPDEVIEAIKTVAGNGSHFGKKEKAGLNNSKVFSEKEIAILQLMSNGLSSEQIGQKMRIG